MPFKSAKTRARTAGGKARAVQKQQREQTLQWTEHVSLQAAKLQLDELDVEGCGDVDAEHLENEIIRLAMMPQLRKAQFRKARSAKLKARKAELSEQAAQRREAKLLRSERRLTEALEYDSSRSRGKGVATRLYIGRRTSANKAPRKRPPRKRHASVPSSKRPSRRPPSP